MNRGDRPRSTEMGARSSQVLTLALTHMRVLKGQGATPNVQIRDAEAAIKHGWPVGTEAELRITGREMMQGVAEFHKL